MTVSDFVWGVMPPLLLVVKSFSSFFGAVVGHLGYRMVQVFYQQLWDSRRSSLPISACFGTSADSRENVKYTGSPKPRMKESRHFFPHRQKTPPVQQRHFRLTRHRLGGPSSTPKLPHWRAWPCKEEAMRLYWTKMGNFPSLFFQAVKRRLTLWKDDMLLYVTKIGKSLPLPEPIPVDFLPSQVPMVFA